MAEWFLCLRQIYFLVSNSDADIEEFSKAFETFSEEFEAMILKEEAILLMILLETFTQDD